MEMASLIWSLLITILILYLYCKTPLLPVASVHLLLPLKWILMRGLLLLLLPSVIWMETASQIWQFQILNLLRYQYCEILPLQAASAHLLFRLKLIFPRITNQFLLPSAIWMEMEFQNLQQLILIQIQ